MSVRERLGGVSIPTQISNATAKEAEAKRNLGKANVGRGTGTSAEFLNVAKSYLQQMSGPQKAHAYNHEIFNGVKMEHTNFNQSGAMTMRGDPAILDLKKVTLTPPHGVSSPEPGIIGGAVGKMGLSVQMSTDMGSLLGGQANWASQKGMTVQKIKERMAELERQVELRKAALARMSKINPDGISRSPTLEQASWAVEEGLPDDYDPIESGTLLVETTKEQAERLHYHLAKMLGMPTN